MRRFLAYVLIFVVALYIASTAQAQTPIDDNYYSAQFGANTKIRLTCFDPYVIPSSPLTVLNPEDADDAADGPADDKLAYNEKMEHVGYTPDAPHEVIKDGKEYSHVLQLRSRDTNLLASVPVQLVNISTLPDKSVDPSSFDYNTQKIFCAMDSEGKATCTQPVLDKWKPYIKTDPCVGRSTENEANTPAGCFSILTQTRASLIPSNGSLTIPYAVPWTDENEYHYFYGIQQFEEEPPAEGTAAPIENEAVGLKLGTFNPLEAATSATPSLTNCVSVFWDPLGRVFNPSGNTLAPIEGVNVSLFTSDKHTFAPVLGKNPTQTDKLGSFSLYVNHGGNYYLSLSKTGFTFPYASSTAESLKQTIETLFPSYELYNNPDQSFFEDQNEVKKFIILMSADPANNPKPEIIHLHEAVENNTHYLSGVSTYPFAIVRTFANSVSVGETRADAAGFFTLTISNDRLPDSFRSFDIQIEVPTLNQLQTKSEIHFGFLSSLIRTVRAQTDNRFSQIYNIEPVPSYVGGFVYDESLNVVPDAQVEIRVPQLGGMVYATAKANRDGFVYMGNGYLPGLPYSVRVLNANSQAVAEFSGNEFAQINEQYRSAKQMNYYLPAPRQPAVLADTRPIMPDADLVEEVQNKKPALDATTLRDIQRRSSARRTLQTTALAQSQPTAAPATTTGQSMIGLLLLLVLIIGLPVGGGFVYMRLRRKPTEPLY